MVVEKVQEDFLLAHGDNVDRSFDDEESGWSTSRGARSNLRVFSRSRTGLVLAALCGFFLCFVLDRRSLSSATAISTVVNATSTVTNATLPALTNGLKTTVLKKPEGLKVVGFLFYGRRMFVNILECHLRKNLVRNGGYLDEIHFIANTKKEEDLEFLDELIRDVPEYKRVNLTAGDWTGLWGHSANLDPDAILIKIDDDVIYIHDDAIPRMVHSLIAHPEAFAVAANMINNPHTLFWQYHTNTLLPYLPEDASLPVDTTPSWRASKLPQHDLDDVPDRFDWNVNARPHHEMQRWLPLPRTSANLWKTPAINSSWPRPRGGATMFQYAIEIDCWQMAAQVHYSFLEHLENGEVDRYFTIGDREGLWNQQYERYSINFMAIRAGKVSKTTMAYNDEVAISMMLPEGAMEPFLVDSHALIGHYSFSTQREILKTDILPRYLDYANENVCAADNQKKWFSTFI